jgi:5-methylcytosine-specific restriction endonuclease McrA
MRVYPKRKIVHCATCGNQLSKRPSQVRNHNFCNRLCQGNFYKTLTGCKSHNWTGTRIQKTCVICQTPFTVLQHRKITAKYCSTKCMGVGQSYLPKEKARNWKGGLTSNMKKYRVMAESKRKAQKLSSYGEITIEEWDSIKKKYNYQCLSCGEKEPDIKLTQDHIVPLSRGGSNLAGNIQPLCRSCNAKKHTRTIYFEQGFEVINMDILPEEYLKIDYEKIGAYARAMKSAGNIPGVEIYNEATIGAGRRAA